MFCAIWTLVKKKKTARINLNLQTQKKRIDQANDFKLSKILVAQVLDRIIYLFPVVEIIIY